MVDFLKESRKASLDKNLKEMKEQRVAQMKSLEKWDITNNFAKATLDLVKAEKDKQINQSKSDGSNTSPAVEVGMEKLKGSIKGKIVKAMEEAYQKEDRKLIDL